MDLNWYTLSLIALVFMGLQRFMYKVSAQRGCNSAWTTFIFMGTVTVLSVVFFFIYGQPVSKVSFLIIIALVNSLSFTIGTMTHMESLKYLPANVAYPVIRLNAAVIVIFSLLFFHDRLSLYQVIGVIISIGVIVTLARDSRGAGAAGWNIKKGFFFVLICMLSGAVASVSSKFAAMYTDKMAFMALSYAIGTLFSFSFRNRLEPEGKRGLHKDAILIGVGMGFLNFAGFYTFLWALDKGPMSIVISIMGLHFIISIILSTIIYSEKFTPVRIIGLILTVVSVILLRL